MSLRGRVFAASYERVLERSERAGLADLRRTLLAGAHGRVIEVGPGPATNLPHYPPAVTELVLAEPEEAMARRLERKLAAAGRDATVVRAPAEHLPVPDDAFDVAVCTLVLCTVEDPDRALAELARVLQPGGLLLLMEHVRAADGSPTARWQDRLERPWRGLAHGCHPNRRTGELLERSPVFEVERLEAATLPMGGPLVRPMVRGWARAR